MRLIKLLFLACLVLAISACTCRTRKVGPGNIPVAQEGMEVKDIHFAFDSYELDATAKAIARANADYLQENEAVQVELEGHCDERGTNEYNMVLGMNRAKAVFDYLRSLGITDDRMTTVSYGEELPLDPASNEAAWAKNRRVHFKVVE